MPAIRSVKDSTYKLVRNQEMLETLGANRYAEFRAWQRPRKVGRSIAACGRCWRLFCRKRLMLGSAFAPMPNYGPASKNSRKNQPKANSRKMSAEYAGYMRANKFVAILKRQAQQIANSRS